MAAPTTKTRLRREPLLKDLKARLKDMDSEIAAYNKERQTYGKQEEEFKKAAEAYRKKVSSLMRKKAPDGHGVTWRYNQTGYELELFMSLAQIEDELGASPKREDFVKSIPNQPSCLATIEVKRGICITQHQLVKEAVYNLTNSDDEHVYQSTYSHIIQFVV